MYLIAAGIAGPAAILIFLIPFFLIYLLKNCRQTKRPLLIRLTILIISLALLATSFYSVFTSYMVNPQYSERFQTYEAPAFWLSNHVQNGGRVLSDCDTLGYIALWYGKERLYEMSVLSFVSIGNFTYDALSKGEYKSPDIFVYNFNLFSQHRLFESLQSWNKFEPLPPDIATKNELDVVYNTGGIWILQLPD